jgi:hypothetical protein
LLLQEVEEKFTVAEVQADLEHLLALHRVAIVQVQLL